MHDNLNAFIHFILVHCAMELMKEVLELYWVMYEQCSYTVDNIFKI